MKMGEDEITDTQDLIDVTELDLFLHEKLVPTPYNNESENLYEYLKKLKRGELVDQTKRRYVILALIISFIGIYSLLSFAFSFIRYIQSEWNVSSFLDQNDVLIDILVNLKIPQEGLINTYLLFLFYIGSGCSIGGLPLLYKYSTRNSKLIWIKLRDQTISFLEVLKDKKPLDLYIQQHKSIGAGMWESTWSKIKYWRRFMSTVQLTHLSFNWEIEWVYPFIFSSFPPLIEEFTLGIAILMLFNLIVSFLSIALIGNNLITVLLFLPLFILAYSVISVLFYRKIFRGYSSLKVYRKVRNLMITNQKLVLLKLRFGEVDPSLILVHQRNLDRLNSIPSIPVPVLLKIAPYISILIGLSSLLASIFLS